MNTMKSIVYTVPGRAEVLDREMPVLADGEALIRVRAGGICGTDMAIVAGKHPRAKPGLVLGHELAGDIVEIKGTAGEFRAGDKVTVYPLLSCGDCWACRNGCAHVCRTLRLIGIDRNGGFAEYMKAPTDLLVKLPAAMSYEVGSLVEPLAVGCHAANMGRIVGGESCMIMGVGPIGLTVGLALRNRGVSRVLATDIDPYRLGLAEKMGFLAVNAREQDVSAKVQEWTGGEGVDALFECAGTESAAREMAALVRPRGTIILTSVHKDPHAVDLRAINFKEITMVGTRVYERCDYDEAIALASTRPVDALISHTLPLDQGVAALDLMKSGKNTCKVLIRTA